LAGAVALLAPSACGGGTTTQIDKTVTTEAATSRSSTIGVPTHVFVMNPGSRRLVAPGEFSFKVTGVVVGEHLHWTNWGEPAATAIGLFTQRRFSTSHRVRFQSTLKLTQLQACKGALYYTRATMPVPSSANFKPSVNPLPTPCG
jgi:hypothetical protein